MSFNKVLILGNTAAAPEVRHLDGGSVVANFRVATSEVFTDRSGNRTERTEWHNIVCWGKTAEVVERFVHKGSQLYIQGKMRTRTYEKDGQTRYSFEVECETLQLLDRRNDGQGQQPQPQYQPQQQYQPQPQPQKNSWDEPIDPIGDLPF